MSAPDKATRRVPLGKPLPSSDEDIARRATVTSEDLAEAAAWWRTHAPKPYRGLLDSEPDEPEEAL